MKQIRKLWRKIHYRIVQSYLKKHITVLSIQKILGAEEYMLKADKTARDEFVSYVYQEMAIEIARKMLKDGLIVCEQEYSPQFNGEIIRMKVKVWK